MKVVSTSPDGQYFPSIAGLGAGMVYRYSHSRMGSLKCVFYSTDDGIVEALWGNEGPGGRWAWQAYILGTECGSHFRIWRIDLL